MSGIARLSVTALDCPDPPALAEFYSRVTGWPVRPFTTDDWVELAADGPVTLAFQKVVDYQQPAWPGQEHPQQVHVDFDVQDLDRAEEQVLAVGARKAEHQPRPESFRVFLDPVDHPFCLVKAG